MANPTETDPVGLDAAGTDAGAMQRLFLLEATSPGYLNKYRAEENLSSMRLMRQTIENRLKSPREYGARGATTATDIVELGNQFAGFSTYPILDARMSANLQDILRFANDPRHPLQKAYRQFVVDSVTASTEDVAFPKAVYPNVTAWRTHGSASPGPRFRELTTLSGNTFYSTLPVPPHPPHHFRHRGHP